MSPVEAELVRAILGLHPSQIVRSPEGRLGVMLYAADPHKAHVGLFISTGEVVIEIEGKNREPVGSIRWHWDPAPINQAG